MNIEKLAQDQLMSFPKEQISTKYKKCMISKYAGIYIGQTTSQYRGYPQGFVRFITNTGGIYEGMVARNEKTSEIDFNGWGRFINGGSIYIGWWKDGV